MRAPELGTENPGLNHLSAIRYPLIRSLIRLSAESLIRSGVSGDGIEVKGGEGPKGRRGNKGEEEEADPLLSRVPSSARNCRRNDTEDWPNHEYLENRLGVGRRAADRWPVLVVDRRPRRADPLGGRARGT